MRFTLLKCLLLFLVTGCAQNKSKSITEFSQNDIKNAILIDVRTPEEFEAGYIDNAINVNWFDPNFATKMQAYDKDDTIYMYCKKGGRSAEAAALLESLGYKNIIDLEGGYDLLSAKK